VWIVPAGLCTRTGSVGCVLHVRTSLLPHWQSRYVQSSCFHLTPLKNRKSVTEVYLAGANSHAAFGSEFSDLSSSMANNNHAIIKEAAVAGSNMKPCGFL